MNETVDLRELVENGEESGQTGETVSTIKQEYTETEQKAMADGWKPEGVDGKEHISAEKFLENGSFFKKINSQKERIEHLETSFKQLDSHYKKVAENEHKKAEAEYKSIIEQLKAEKAEAIKEGDGKRAVEIDDAIEHTEKPVLEKPQIDPVFDAWVSENSWYEKDKFLGVEADILAEKYLAKGLTGKDLLDSMTEHLKTLHPDRFKEERERPALVEEGARAPNRSSSKNVTERNLTADERAIFKNFNRMGIFKTDEEKTKYFNEVIKLRD